MQQFINDFKNSQFYSKILQDSKTEVILIWITGSTITNICDKESDYDMCVLVTEKPMEPANSLYRTYSRPGSYFLKYKPEDKKAQCIYNDVSDIYSISSATPLDNIGWAQFREITPEFIIYQNPKYTKFIETLINIRYELFNISAYLFVESILHYIGVKTLNCLLYQYPGRPNKFIYHACWLANSLQGLPQNKKQLIRLKRIPAEDLSIEDQNQVVDSLSYLETYHKLFDKTSL